MKILLLLFIKLYWIVIAKRKRRKCIFRISCSQFVYQITKKEGLYKGLLAFRYRWLNCRGGFHFYENYVDGSRVMILPNAKIITEDEISERFFKS